MSTQPPPRAPAQEQARTARRLVLGSSSAYRRALLERLRVPFEIIAPDIDESAHPGESPHALVERLSRAKAERVARDLGDGLVIGSDQVAVIDGEVLGKPGTHGAAVRQLRRVSGREVVFLTGLCLIDTASLECQLDVIRIEVGFEALDEARIEAYLGLDEPFQCAGSIRAESLGVSLFRYIRSDDPNALIGLPLIRLCQMLRNVGYDILSHASR